MSIRSYTLVSCVDGVINPMEERLVTDDRNVAMVALTISEDNSAVIVEGCEKGEISGYRKLDGKVSVFSIEGEPSINLLLLLGPVIISPIVEENDGITIRISPGRIYRTLVNAVNMINKAQLRVNLDEEI